MALQSGKGGPDTRSRILIAAAEMLASDPTARLSVRGVATRAGVSVGSLRHFFPTQRQLIDTVVAGLQTLDVPDDPIGDLAAAPADRLVACLQLMLSEVGAGEHARAYLGSLHDAYVASPPDPDAEHTFLALERFAVHRVEGWLAALREEGVPVTGDLDRLARFLVTVVNGLALERALPGAQGRVASETHSLRIAASAALAAP